MEERSPGEHYTLYYMPEITGHELSARRRALYSRATPRHSDHDATGPGSSGRCLCCRCKYYSPQILSS